MQAALGGRCGSHEPPREPALPDKRVLVLLVGAVGLRMRLPPRKAGDAMTCTVDDCGCGCHVPAVSSTPPTFGTHPSGEHRMWDGAKDRDGYGLVWIPGVGHERAPRVAWKEASGTPIPPKHVIAHTCDEPGCVRNDGISFYPVATVLIVAYGHLFAATNAGNIADRVFKGRGRGSLGDKNGSRTRPDRRARADANGARKHPEALRRGDGIPWAKLTNAAVLEMRRAAAVGVTHHALAQQFGVSPQTADKAIAGKTWKHVSGQEKLL